MNASTRRMFEVVEQDRENDAALLAQEKGRLAVKRELRARNPRRDFWAQLPRRQGGTGMSRAAEARGVAFAFVMSIAAGLMAGAALKGAFHLLMGALAHLPR